MMITNFEQYPKRKLPILSPFWNLPLDRIFKDEFSDDSFTETFSFMDLLDKEDISNESMPLN